MYTLYNYFSKHSHMSEKLPEQEKSASDKLTTKNSSENITQQVTKESTDILDISILVYAKENLSEDQYDTIEEKWLSYPWMTIEKIDLLADDNLTIEQLGALWWEAIVHPNMTYNKLGVLGYMLSEEDINKYSSKIIAEISIEGLNLIIELASLNGNEIIDKAILLLIETDIKRANEFMSFVLNTDLKELNQNVDKTDKNSKKLFKLIKNISKINNEELTIITQIPDLKDIKKLVELIQEPAPLIIKK